MTTSKVYCKIEEISYIKGKVSNDMLERETEYTLQMDQLRKLLRTKKTFHEAIALALEIHAITHTSVVSSSAIPTFCDSVLEGLRDVDYRIMPTKKDETIAWHLWHIARIEDVVGNVLMSGQTQIFNDEWMLKMNVHVKDTGNAMSDEQIKDFSNQVNIQALIHYRNAVGKQTRNILKSLTPSDLKRRADVENLKRIVSEGALLECKESLWLNSFWGRLTFLGLILTPLTRHHMMHLPDSMAIKEYVKQT